MRYLRAFNQCARTMQIDALYGQQQTALEEVAGYEWRLETLKQEWSSFLDCYCAAWTHGQMPLGLLSNPFSGALIVTKLVRIILHLLGRQACSRAHPRLVRCTHTQDGASIIRECGGLEALYRYGESRSSRKTAVPIQGYSQELLRMVECARELAEQVGPVAMADFEAELFAGLAPKDTILRHLSLLHVSLCSDADMYVDYSSLSTPHAC